MGGMNGILLRAEDEQIRRLAKGNGLPVEISAEPRLPFDRTLIVGPGRAVPWHLVKAGFAFLERWEAAAPLTVNLLAAEIGTAGDRERTAAMVRDLRVPVYACDLLFVRAGEAGEQLLAAWRSEMADGAEERLAFLRALYQVKPVFLALPRSWLAETAVVQEPRRQKVGVMTKLIEVQIAPGRYVCCRPEEAEEWKRRLAPAPKRRTSDAR